MNLKMRTKKLLSLLSISILLICLISLIYQSKPHDDTCLDSAMSDGGEQREVSKGEENKDDRSRRSSFSSNRTADGKINALEPELRRILVDIGRELHRELVRGDPSIPPFKSYNPSEAKLVLINSLPRSGSSLVGEFAAQFPGVFYNFEPNHFSPAETADIVEMLLNCDFSGRYHGKVAIKYLDDFRRAEADLGFFSRNRRVWPHCAPFDRCFEPELLASGGCEMFPVRVAKVINELGLPAVQDLLERIPKLKILSLFRDPRAVALSQIRAFEAEIDPHSFCSFYDRSAQELNYLAKKFPQQIFTLRYEDFVERPFVVANRMASFLDLEFTEKVFDFLKSRLEAPSTKQDELDRDHFGTNKNRGAFSWVKEAEKSSKSASLVEEIQDACRYGMNLLGYSNIWRKDAEFSKELELMKVAEPHG